MQKNREGSIFQLQCISEMIKYAEEYGLLSEVIFSAINAASDNPELSIQNICEIALGQWDI